LTYLCDVAAATGEVALAVRAGRDCRHACEAMRDAPYTQIRKVS